MFKAALDAASLFLAKATIFEGHILSPLLTQNLEDMSKEFVNLQFKVTRGELLPVLPA